MNSKSGDSGGDPGVDAIESEALDRLKRLGGSKLLRQMIDLFFEHGSRHIEILCKTESARHLRDAERAAHSLKTSAGHLGATRLFHLASGMEEAAASHQTDQIRVRRGEVISEFSRASAQLAQVRATLEGIP